MSGVGKQEEVEEEEKKPVVFFPHPRYTYKPNPVITTTYQNLDGDPSAQGHINLKVKAQDGTEVLFRIKKITQLIQLMNAYCDRRSVAINSVVFLFDGRRLRAEQTPYELGMEDGDEIDAMLHQTGGASTF